MLQNGTALFSHLCSFLNPCAPVVSVCWHWCLAGPAGKWVSTSGKPAPWTALPRCQIDATFGASEQLACSEWARQWNCPFGQRHCPFGQQIGIRCCRYIPKRPFSAYRGLNYISAMPGSDFNYPVPRDNCTSCIFKKKVQNLLHCPDNFHGTVSCEQSLTHLDVS